MSRAYIDDQMNKGIFNAFDEIDAIRARLSQKPSKVEDYLNDNWGSLYAEMWQDWWRESGEEYA